MKESISYSFLLNIVLLFIFICFAIIMGTLSYFKAYKANKIISETIEKYEGYNCMSEQEIAKKLASVGYNPPFTVRCNNNGNCVTDTAQTYKIVSYNLDKGMDKAQIVFSKNASSDNKYVNMNSSYKCDNTNGCVTNKNYQYGIYTYMYVDFPAVSSLLKLSLFTKTSIMYEFRDFYVEEKAGTTSYVDTSSTFDLLYNKKYENGKIYIQDAVKLENSNPTTDITESYIASYISRNPERNLNTAKDLLGAVFMDIYSDASTSDTESYAFRNHIYTVSSHNTESLSYRDRLMVESYKTTNTENKISSKTVSLVLGSKNQIHECGYTPNYGALGGIN